MICVECVFAEVIYCDLNIVFAQLTKTLVYKANVRPMLRHQPPPSVITNIMRIKEPKANTGLLTNIQMMSFSIRLTFSNLD